MSPHPDNDEGPDFERLDAQHRAEQLSRCRERASAPEDADARARRVKTKWALRKERQNDCAAVCAAPFWTAQTVLNWIAFRKPERIDRDLLEETPLYGNAGWHRFEERRPGDALLKALRSDALTAIGPDGATIHPAKWLRLPGVRLNDHRTWREISFPRDQVLSIFPAAQKPDAAANSQAKAEAQQQSDITAERQAEEAAGEQAESAAPAIAPAKALAAIPEKTMPNVSEIADFISTMHRRLVEAGEMRPNRATAKAAAEKHFGRWIQWKIWNDAFEATGIENKGGAPKKPRNRQKII